MRTIIPIILLICAAPGWAQQCFNNYNYGPPQRVARKIYPLNDGGYIVMGNIDGLWINTCVLRLDNNGDTLWTKQYGTDSIQYLTYAMTPCSDGGWLLCGDHQSVANGAEMESLVMKTDSLGNVTWCQVFGQTGKDFADFAEEADDGTIAVSGWAKFLWTDSSGVQPYPYFQGY